MTPAAACSALLAMSLLLSGTPPAVARQAPPPGSSRPVPPPAATGQVPLQPCDDCVPGVINFAKVSPALWRGAQPTAEGFRALERMGVRTVVSFRHDHDDLPLLAGTSLRYLRIPSRAYHPDAAKLREFLRIMAEPSNWPVYVHCAQGRDRTGYNVAIYRMAVQGWSVEEALKEMKAFRFNQAWFWNPSLIRQLDLEKLKQALKDPRLLPVRPAEGKGGAGQ